MKGTLAPHYVNDAPAVFGLSLSRKHLEDEVCNLSTTFLPKHSSFFPHISTVSTFKKMPFSLQGSFRFVYSF